MRTSVVKNGLVLVVIFLFVGVAVQPSIADVSIESDNSELVEITIQICNGNGANDHTVMLTQEQAEELEKIINRTKTKLDAAETMEETSVIFNETVFSLYEFGVLPDGMSIEDAKRLVNGKEQNQRIANKLERWFSRNQEKKETVENFLCLIAGHTNKTYFTGPLSIPLIILYIIIAIIDVNIDMPLVLNLPFVFLYGLSFLTWQFNPLAFGHMISFGEVEDGTPWFPPISIPAKGWIYTIGLNGIKNWNSFIGRVLGFTGIKICLSLRTSIYQTHFYLGAALMVDGEC